MEYFNKQNYKTRFTTLSALQQSVNFDNIQQKNIIITPQLNDLIENINLCIDNLQYVLTNQFCDLLEDPYTYINDIIDQKFPRVKYFNNQTGNITTVLSNLKLNDQYLSASKFDDCINLLINKSGKPFSVVNTINGQNGAVTIPTAIIFNNKTFIYTEENYGVINLGNNLIVKNVTPVTSINGNTELIINNLPSGIHFIDNTDNLEYVVKVDINGNIDINNSVNEMFKAIYMSIESKNFDSLLIENVGDSATSVVNRKFVNQNNNIIIKSISFNKETNQQPTKVNITLDDENFLSFIYCYQNSKIYNIIEVNKNSNNINLTFDKQLEVGQYKLFYLKSNNASTYYSIIKTTQDEQNQESLPESTTNQSEELPESSQDSTPIIIEPEVETPETPPDSSHDSDPVIPSEDDPEDSDSVLKLRVSHTLQDNGYLGRLQTSTNPNIDQSKVTLYVYGKRWIHYPNGTGGSVVIDNIAIPNDTQPTTDRYGDETNPGWLEIRYGNPMLIYNGKMWIKAVYNPGDGSDTITEYASHQVNSILHPEVTLESLVYYDINNNVVTDHAASAIATYTVTGPIYQVVGLGTSLTPFICQYTRSDAVGPHTIQLISKENFGNYSTYIQDMKKYHDYDIKVQTKNRNQSQGFYPPQITNLTPGIPVLDHIDQRENGNKVIFATFTTSENIQNSYHTTYPEYSLNGGVTWLEYNSDTGVEVTTDVLQVFFRGRHYSTRWKHINGWPETDGMKNEGISELLLESLTPVSYQPFTIETNLVRNNKTIIEKNGVEQEWYKQQILYISTYVYGNLITDQNELSTQFKFTIYSNEGIIPIYQDKTNDISENQYTSVPYRKFDLTVRYKTLNIAITKEFILPENVYIDTSNST